MTVLKIKKYRGANIVIWREFQTFTYVVFYSGQFFVNRIEINKVGEYTDKECAEAIVFVLEAAKETVNSIKERSFPNNIIKTIKDTCLKFLRILKVQKVITRERQLDQ